MNHVLRMDNITRTFGSGPAEVRALRGISLTVAEGELVAVMGPSGSGKSTLLLVAGGLERPDSGDVLVCGTDLAGASRAELAAARRRTIGYVFQDYNLVPALTAVENVALPLELDGVHRTKAYRQAVAALEEMELVECADRFPDEMSGGQRQRIAIARAVVGQRRLILADEPTGALDTEAGDSVLRMLRARVDDGVAAVLVTHDSRNAAWADRVVYLSDGLVVDGVLW